MAIYQNIQVSNQRQQSKYPFDSAASLMLDKYTFPSHLIKSLSFQVSECVFPVYISSIQAQNKKVIFTVSDMAGKNLGTIELISQTRGIVLDSYGCVCGGISFFPVLYKWCMQLVSNTRYKHLSLISSQLPLSSSALVCVYYTGYRGISFGGNYIGSEVTFNFQRSVFPEVEDNAIKLNIWGDMTKVQQEEAPICLTKVNGVSMIGGSLTIKHKVLSDARVITSPNKLIIKGVLDVTGNE